MNLNIKYGGPSAAYIECKCEIVVRCHMSRANNIECAAEERETHHFHDTKHNKKAFSFATAAVHSNTPDGFVYKLFK